MIALGLVGLLAAYVLLWSGFKGTDPRDEILAAIKGGIAPKKLAAIPVSVTSGGGATTDTPPQTRGTPSTSPGGSMPRGVRVIATVSDHRSRPLGNWESDNAIDIVPEPNSGSGTPVKAVVAGTIGFAFGYQRTGGYRLHLLQGRQDEFYYAHFSGYAPGILPGRRVNAGQVIGYMGDTGNARGTPHVHLGRRNGDPNAYANEIF